MLNCGRQEDRSGSDSWDEAAIAKGNVTRPVEADLAGRSEVEGEDNRIRQVTRLTSEHRPGKRDATAGGPGLERGGRRGDLGGTCSATARCSILQGRALVVPGVAYRARWWRNRFDHARFEFRPALQVLIAWDVQLNRKALKTPVVNRFYTLLQMPTARWQGQYCLPRSAVARFAMPASFLRSLGQPWIGVVC